jgi:competence protein CoiA
LRVLDGIVIIISSSLMLCARQKSTSKTVTAYLARKLDAPFFCLVCGDEVLLKAGAMKVNYFAHKNPLACRFNSNESAEHRRCKFEIYRALLQQPNVEKAAMERPLGTNRPDVSALINGVPVAIEIQISSLSEETIKLRTMEYAKKGIYVLWLLLWTPDLANLRYSPRAWEKWIHATYFGRVYYWIEGLTVACYSFEPSLKSVPRKSWYSKKGKKTIAGGHSQRSKRYRTAVRGKTLSLAKDFIPKDRDWWEGNGIIIPFAKLFMHRHSIGNHMFTD